MRVIFAGTPEFAAQALADVLAAGHEVVLVLTQPDRPAGRGMKCKPSAVKSLALAHGIPVAQPQGLRLDGRYADEAQVAQHAIMQAQADVMIVAAYGLILPSWVLQAPRWGCLNIHASLLPRWRGAAPIHRAVEAGDAETGVCIMQMDAGLDTGPVLLRQALAIAADDSTSTLHDKLARLGGELMVQALAQLAHLRPQAQPEQGITYAEKIRKEEAQIDWQQAAAVLARKSRAFDPFPGCVAAWQQAEGDVALKVWRMEPMASAQPAPVGQVQALSAEGIVVACGPDGSQRVRLTQLQKPGGKRLAAADFLAGTAMAVGAQLR